MRRTEAGPEHDAIFELLPWHANGTLDASETARVEQHLAECAACRDELALCRDAALAIHTTEDVGWEPSAGHLERLVERLPAESGAPSSGASIVALLGAWWGELPGRVRWVVAAQSALAAGLAGAVLWLASAPAPQMYETLSTPAPPAATGALRLQLAFAGDATVEDVADLLRATGGTIVDGPSALGVFTVAFGAEASLEDVAEALRADPRVRLAEPLGMP